MTRYVRLAEDHDEGASIPEKALWRAVIYQAILDLDTLASGGEITSDHSSMEVHWGELNSFFFDTSGAWRRSFESISILADIEPDYLRRRAARIAEGGERLERYGAGGRPTHAAVKQPKQSKAERMIARVIAYIEAAGRDVEIAELNEGLGVSSMSIVGALRFSPNCGVERVGPGLYRYTPPAEPAAAAA